MDLKTAEERALEGLCGHAKSVEGCKDLYKCLSKEECPYSLFIDGVNIKYCEKPRGEKDG